MMQHLDIDAVERKVTRLLDDRVVGCWIRGVRGEPGFWSKEVYAMHGLPFSEQAPSADVILRQFDAQGQVRMWDAVNRCAKGGTPLVLEYTVPTVDGRARRLKSVGHAARSAAGESVIVGTLQDLSELDPLRCEIQGLTESLRKVQRSRDQEGLSTRQWARVDALIRERGGRDLLVREMAAHVGLSAPEFARRFKLTTGETPHQYLLRYRLECASQALRAGDVSIAQIAVDYGFFDQAHFSRHFKRRYGLTPARFSRTLDSIDDI